MSAEERARMVEYQLRRRGIGDERVLAAMDRVPRERFLPREQRDAAYADAALAIGAGQTISQPYMVALICEQLALQGGERVLDVGTGPATRRPSLPSSRPRCTRSSGSRSLPSRRARISSRRATTAACTSMSATARSA